MDNVKCKICGHKHSNHEPHVFSDAVAEAKIIETSQRLAKPLNSLEACPVCEKRREYQRELMRKRRANKN